MRCGARARASTVVAAARAAQVRTFALTDLAWALRGARRGRAPALARRQPRARSSTRRRPPRCCGRGRARSASTRRPPATARAATALWQRPRRAPPAARRRRCCCRWRAGALARRRRRRTRRAVVVPIAGRAVGPRGAPRATSPRSPTRPTRRRRASTACSPPGPAARRDGEELVVAGRPTRASTPRASRVRRAARAGRAVPRAAAARARVRDRAAARGLRDRAARGARGRLPARHDAGARALRGAADRARLDPRAGRRRPRGARSAPRSTTPRPATPSAAPAALAPFRPAAVDRVVAPASCCRALLRLAPRRRRRRPLAQRRELLPRPRVGDLLGRQPRAARGRDALAHVLEASRRGGRRSRSGSCTPASAAARAWTSSRSRRSGCALISSIVPVRAAASITRVDVDRVRRARLDLAAGRVADRVDQRVLDRGDHPLGHRRRSSMPNEVWTEPITQSSSASSSSS